MKIPSLLAAILLLIAVSCQNKIDTQKIEEEIFQADIAFSDLSKEQGRNAAFIAYCAEDAVMLAPNSMPIESKEIIIAKFLSDIDSTFSLTWHPVNAFAANSGEMGYTYGLWNLETTDTTGNKISKQGTYATFWKKNDLGEWKFVLDIGNEGLSPKNEE